MENPHLKRPANQSTKYRNVKRKTMTTKRTPASEAERDFMTELTAFMTRQRHPIERLPTLGFKEIDLYSFYRSVQNLGGYDEVTHRKLWKRVYCELGSNPSSTSAATCARRHYERLLLPFERHRKREMDQRGGGGGGGGGGGEMGKVGEEGRERRSQTSVVHVVHKEQFAGGNVLSQSPFMVPPGGEGRSQPELSQGKHSPLHPSTSAGDRSPQTHNPLLPLQAPLDSSSHTQREPQTASRCSPPSQSASYTSGNSGPFRLQPLHYSSLTGGAVIIQPTNTQTSPDPPDPPRLSQPPTDRGTSLSTSTPSHNIGLPDSQSPSNGGWRVNLANQHSSGNCPQPLQGGGTSYSQSGSFIVPNSPSLASYRQPSLSLTQPNSPSLKTYSQPSLSLTQPNPPSLKTYSQPSLSLTQPNPPSLKTYSQSSLSQPNSLPRPSLLPHASLKHISGLNLTPSNFPIPRERQAIPTPNIETPPRHLTSLTSSPQSGELKLTRAGHGGGKTPSGGEGLGESAHTPPSTTPTQNTVPAAGKLTSSNVAQNSRLLLQLLNSTSQEHVSSGVERGNTSIMADPTVKCHQLPSKQEQDWSASDDPSPPSCTEAQGCVVRQVNEVSTVDHQSIVVIMPGNKVYEIKTPKSPPPQWNSKVMIEHPVTWSLINQLERHEASCSCPCSHGNISEKVGNLAVELPKVSQPAVTECQEYSTSCLGGDVSPPGQFTENRKLWKGGGGSGEERDATQDMILKLEQLAKAYDQQLHQLSQQVLASHGESEMPTLPERNIEPPFINTNSHDINTYPQDMNTNSQDMIYTKTDPRLAQNEAAGFHGEEKSLSSITSLDTRGTWENSIPDFEEGQGSGETNNYCHHQVEDAGNETLLSTSSPPGGVEVLVPEGAVTSPLNLVTHRRGLPLQCTCSHDTSIAGSSHD